ncbi:MAG: HAMP domain-containing histidine kinase, partial [Burkholderiales bacterium]|nr:HAMP domain-containing histidine kinase [Burkholderiales bacterium]
AGAAAPPRGAEGGAPGALPRRPPLAVVPGVPGLPDGIVLVALLALLFAAVAAGAWPVVRQLTRRLEALERGVEAFGAGALHERVAVEGRDEVATLATSFNRAAARIEALLRSHQSLLANASHELRSPLARLKMALAMLEDAPPARHAALRAEIAANIAELDALVDEVLLASRLDAAAGAVARDPVDLLALAAEEAARSGAEVEGTAVVVAGDERLLRRALRNLLENARRYGVAPAGGAGGDSKAQARDAATTGRAPAAPVTVTVESDATCARIRVGDRGPGVPDELRERIFEPFFRLPGHAEREGGVGLGLSLVRQIAQRHGGRVSCQARAGGGSCFTLELPASTPPAPPAPPRAGGDAGAPAAR